MSDACKIWAASLNSISGLSHIDLQFLHFDDTSTLLQAGLHGNGEGKTKEKEKWTREGEMDE